MDERLCIALRESVLETEVLSAAYNYRWYWSDRFAASKNRPYEITFITRDRQTSVHYIEDFLLDVHYILAIGPEADRISREAQASLATYVWADAATRLAAATTPAERVAALHLAAATLPPEPDSAIIVQLEAEASHADAEVRQAACLAMGYSGWLPFRALLERLKSSDPSSQVRKGTQVILAAWDKSVVPATARQRSEKGVGLPFRGFAAHARPAPATPPV